MIVTVLWEDRRGGVVTGFGPHELLLACVRDDLRLGPEAIRHIKGLPCKGNGGLKKQLSVVARRSHGPVVGVFDWDEVDRLWSPPPPRCKAEIKAKLHGEVAHPVVLVFLEQNVESLLAVACEVLGRDEPVAKPTPDQRDRLLAPLHCHGSSAEPRRRLREKSPSFDYLVRKVAALARPAAPA